ncbi:MAG: CehA/McbA family metallohydrolase [Bacteroidales bacterium]
MKNLKKYAFLFVLLNVCNLTFSQSIDTVGVATTTIPFTYASNSTDITSGTPYYYLKNDSLWVTISTVDVNNNQVGGIHKGVPMDIVHRRKMRENLDWTQFILAPSIQAGWDLSTYNLNLSNISFDNSTKSVNAIGTWVSSGLISAKVNYKLLPGSPVMRINLSLYNNGTTAFTGYLEYQIDPDETGEQYSYVPGVGWIPGMLYSGWTSNYTYTGVNQNLNSNYPAHGIAWYQNTPAAIIANNVNLGVSFAVSIPAGDSAKLTIYHISNIPDNTSIPNYNCIKKWADTLMFIDSEISNLSKVYGVVKDTLNQAVKNISVTARDINGTVAGKISTNLTGNYQLMLPKANYTFTVAGLGYSIKSRTINSNIDSVLDFTNLTTAAPSSVSVWAGFGKTIPTGIVQGTESDVIMENSKLAISIANTSVDDQLAFITKGRPLDLAATGFPDDLDWINLFFASKVKPQGSLAGQAQSVKYDSVFVSQLNNAEATVTCQGHYIELQGVNADSVVVFNNLAVTTTYNIKPDKRFIFVESVITNNTGQQQGFWVGDALDYDGTGQTSWVPGTGVLTSSNLEYQPAYPWIAQYGDNAQVFGFIYENTFANQFKAYGSNSFIMAYDSVNLLNGNSYSLKRYLTTAATLGYTLKSDVMQELYNEIILGVSANLQLNKNVAKNNDTVIATLTLINTKATASSPFVVNLSFPKNISCIGNLNLNIPSILANDSNSYIWKFVGNFGGRGIVEFVITDTSQNSINKSEKLFVNSGGWYGGDNHLHSTFSDGTGTVSENIAAGYNLGLSFLTATDHNSISQNNDVNLANSTYDDFLAILGEEITTSCHILAYNISSLRPWNNTTYTYQQLIDSIRADNNAEGVAYLAHPYHTTLYWRDWTVSGYTGIEVWNGIPTVYDVQNTNAFVKWDALNNQGKHIFGIANSDGHSSAAIGHPHIVAWLDSLSKNEVIKVLKSGKYYGTNGPEMYFTIDNKMMGSDLKVPLTGKSVSIKIDAKFNQNITEVRLIKNGNLLISWQPNIDSINYTYNTTALPGDFFRAEVKSGSTYLAYSNPIWIKQGSSNASLFNIKVDNNLLSGFNDTIYHYSLAYPLGTTTVPYVTAVSSDSNSILMVTQALSMNGSVADRTATINILAEDNVTTKSYKVEFNTTTCTESSQKSKLFKFYPNPTSGELFIEMSPFSNDFTYVEIVNVAGDAVLNKKLTNQKNNIYDISHLKKGVYFIRIKGEKRITEYKKFILE